MSRKKQNALIIAAGIVLLLALAGIAYVLLFMKTGAEDGGTTERVHEATEYYTNEDGSPKQTVFYKNNKYAGSIDYVTKDNTDYVIHYDENDKEIKSEKYTFNTAGKPLTESIKENGAQVSLVEYTYEQDGTTLWKKVTKTYRDGTEYAVREIYSPDGKVIETHNYENGVEVNGGNSAENNGAVS